LPRLSENGVQILGILDEVDLEASPDRESPTRCGDGDYAETAVDCRNEDFLASWHYALVLIDEEHGEGGIISIDPLPSHVVASQCRPSTAIAGSEDLVGAGGGDQGKEGDERTHGKEVKKKDERGGREGDVNGVDEKG